MQITFIVGNGFDVGAGYHTQYSDFYTKLLAATPTIPADKPYIESIIDSIKQDRAGDKKYWSDFEWGLGRFTSEFYGANYRRLLKKYPSTNPPTGVQAFTDCFLYAVGELQKFLSDKARTFNSAALNATDLGAAERVFVKFFLERDVRQHLNSLINAKKNEDWKLNFITFNYTPILRGYLARLSALNKSSSLHPGGLGKKLTFGPVIQAHGDLGDVIMGVGNYSQIASRSLRNNPNLCNLIVKPALVSSSGMRSYHDGVEAIFRSSIVCIYGASMGETDIFWWTKIAEWLYRNDQRHLIIYHYDNQAQNGNALTRANNGNAPKATFMRFAYAWMRENSASIDAGKIATLENRVHVVTHDIKLKHP